MISDEEQQMEIFANKIVVDIKKNPFSYRDDIVISNYTEEQLLYFESLLTSKMPNLVIRHTNEETPEELSQLLTKVKEIFARGEQPYFMYLPKPNEKVKDLKR